MTRVDDAFSDLSGFVPEEEDSILDTLDQYDVKYNEAQNLYGTHMEKAKITNETSGTSHSSSSSISSNSSSASIFSNTTSEEFIKKFSRCLDFFVPCHQVEKMHQISSNT